jgi:putative DNA primase/helicase
MLGTLAVAAILAEHAKAAYGLMGSDPSQDCARAILRWIERDRVERFSARDTLEKVKGRFPTMEKVNAGLSILVERAFIFETTTEPHKGPGRKPSTAFTVNPRMWE